MPPFVRESHGLWLDVPRMALEILSSKNINPASGVHAASHAIMSFTPLYVMTSEGDIRTECKAPEKEFASKASSRKRPARLIIYDAPGTGGGVCAKAFDHISKLLDLALEAIVSCSCEEGCPLCKLKSLIV